MHWATGLHVRKALLAALVASVTIVAQPVRNADLQRIRADIARLRGRLADVRAQAETAERDLEAVDLELDIRTRELQLAVDMQSQLEAQHRELESHIAVIGPRV